MAKYSKVSKSVSNPSVSLMKELKELKHKFKDIEEGIMQLQESSTKLLDLVNSIISEIIMVRLGLDGLKQEGDKLFAQVLSRMDSLKSLVSSSNDDLAIFVQNSYSSFVKNIKKSYGEFCQNMHNTLTYFLVKQ
ncbi:hypothetical protein FXO38_03906 [Capsicum annuum]|nr:hypothetical protein FXO37_22918 [Capsicum annuum]KAF3677217.1 hypothetical protein FXO38_03906 [Capsicum annuum]